MDWIETNSGNRIARKSQLHGAENVHIKGSTTVCDNVLLQGDVPLTDGQSTAITIGKYCYIDHDAQVIPPVLVDTADGTKHSPVNIGSYVIVGSRAVIRAAAIGNRVYIEPDCLIGELSVVYDCCVVRRGCQIPPKTIIPPFSEVSGRPGDRFTIKSLSNAYRKTIEMACKEAHITGLT